MSINFLHVAVLMGGFGEEREVSINSGKACSKALLDANYKVTEIIVDENLPHKLQKTDPDVCFNALHGKFGEDGTIQGFLNTMKIPYTHSGVSASSIAINKLITKSFLIESTRNELDPIMFPKNIKSNDLSYLEDLLPIVVKPICGGSSVGVKIIKNFEDLKNFSNFLIHDNLMIEPLVGNKELTVTVLKNQPLTVTEIVSRKGFFYDYDSKYTNNGSSHILPAKIPKHIFDKAMSWALRAHQIIGCKGISRSDFRYDDKLEILYLLEINTQPGMTETSLAPEQARFCKINMSNLVNTLICEAEWEN